MPDLDLPAPLLTEAVVVYLLPYVLESFHGPVLALPDAPRASDVSEAVQTAQRVVGQMAARRVRGAVHLVEGVAALVVATEGGPDVECAGMAVRSLVLALRAR